MAAKEKKSFGGCRIAKVSPSRTALSANTKALNVVVSFEEALKLHRALDECLSRLNRYDRNTKAGRRTALCLTLFLDVNSITVTEDNLPR